MATTKIIGFIVHTLLIITSFFVWNNYSVLFYLYNELKHILYFPWFDNKKKPWLIHYSISMMLLDKKKSFCAVWFWLFWFFFKLSNNVIFNNKIFFYVRRSSIFPLHGFHYLEVAQSLSTCLELKDFLTKISMKPI